MIYDASGEPMGAVRSADSLLGRTGEPLVSGPAASSGRSLQRGGPVNPRSGMGTGSDKGDATFWIANVLRTRFATQTLYAQSWAAKALINYPVDDMFVRGRLYDQTDEEKVKLVEEAEHTLKLQKRVKQAMISGRLYGTGLLVIVTDNGEMDTPLNPKTVKAGSLKNLLVFDRFDCSVSEMITDIADPGYGTPTMYTFNPRFNSSPLLVHPSRVIRFDGREAPNSEGWASPYDHEWGLSELIHAITEISHDAGIMGAIAHLVQEASIAVVKVPGMRDAIAGNPTGDDPTMEDYGAQFSLDKSVWKTIFLDIQDDFLRTSVTFAGLPELLNHSGIRLGAVAGIPATRMMGRSPVGMNATGESDLMNYAILVAALQESLLQPNLKLLDEIIARHVGLSEPLSYEWRPLTDLSEQELADALNSKATALQALVSNQIITENEAREVLNDDPHFGSLENLPEEEITEMALKGQPEEPEVVVAPARASNPAK